MIKYDSKTKASGVNNKAHIFLQKPTTSSKFTLINILIFINLILNCNCLEPVKQSATKTSDIYYEDLFIKPLNDGKLFAQFKFTTLYRNDIKSLRWENKIEIFPLSLADLVASTDLNRLHFSLTKGNWNYRQWGYSTRPSPPGAQIRVQFSQHNENPDRSWDRLINLLAGKFCASLMSANERTKVFSKLAFNQAITSPANQSQHIHYVNLPEETFCTENLTPWKKLLPCYSSSGLASLLNPTSLLKSSYSSLAIDLVPTISCNGNDDCQERVQLTQTIGLVFNPLHLFEGRQTWSLAKILGNSIQQKCQLASHSRVHVDITNLDEKSKLYPQTYQEHNLDIKLSDKSIETRTFATFDVNLILSNKTVTASGNNQLNIGIKQTKLFKRPPTSSRPTLPVYLRSHVAGLGAGDGTIVATISNTHDKPVRLTYMDVIPYFLRVYLHTLTIRTKSGQELKPDKLNFVLSKENKPTLIEFSIVVPANSETQISYDFERAFLRWTDYRPDANKGVLLGSATISINLRSGLNHLVFPVNSVASRYTSLDYGSYEEGDVFRVYARPLLIILPTPDFTMPYNVICLVCTVLVIAIGPLHDMTTKRPVIKAIRKEGADKDGECNENTSKENDKEGEGKGKEEEGEETNKKSKFKKDK